MPTSEKGNFTKLVNSETPVLIDFFATWCGPCQAMSPILSDISGELGNKLRIIKIDVDKNQAIAQKYQIRGVPTLMLFQSGQLLWQQSGLPTKQALLTVLKQRLGIQ